MVYIHNFQFYRYIIHICWVFFVPLKYILLFKKGKSVTIAGKKLQLYDSVRRFGPLSREGFISCHTCYDTTYLIRKAAPARVSQGLNTQLDLSIHNQNLTDSLFSGASPCR